YRHLRLSLHEWRSRRRARSGAGPANSVEGALEVEAVKEEIWQSERLFPGPQVLRQEWLSVYEWAVAGYRPEPYPGKVTFFWTEEEPTRKNGWRSWITNNEVDIHIVPGNHITSRTC